MDSHKPQGVEEALSALAGHDVMEHPGIYEQLLSQLQQELNSQEQGGTQ